MLFHWYDECHQAECRDTPDTNAPAYSCLTGDERKKVLLPRIQVSIVVVFALSWFPLNILNLILDIHDIFQV
jgi:hypothetical protein